MDKRSINTRKNIKNTYVDMLMNKEPINVRSLVKKAKINKSTFYRYYPYIDELEEELLREIAAKIYEECTTTDSKMFLENFFDYYENHIDERSKTLFNANITKTVQVFSNYVQEIFKKKNNDVHHQLLLYVVSSGCLALFLDRKYSREDKKKAIIEIGKSYREKFYGQN